jgi:hypothetical protein
VLHHHWCAVCNFNATLLLHSKDLFNDSNKSGDWLVNDVKISTLKPGALPLQAFRWCSCASPGLRTLRQAPQLQALLHALYVRFISHASCSLPQLGLHVCTRRHSPHVMLIAVIVLTPQGRKQWHRSQLEKLNSMGPGAQYAATGQPVRILQTLQCRS